MSRPEDFQDDEALLARVGACLSARTGRTVEAVNLRRYPAGFSWLTFGLELVGVDAAGSRRAAILRIGPDYGLFAPYSALPQVLSMQSVAGGRVPVPDVWWYDDDPAPLGAPFLITSKSPGDVVIAWASSALRPLDDAARVTLGEDFIDILAALHRTDWTSRPIAALGQGTSRENAAQREIDVWQHEYERWAMRPWPMFEWGLRWLRDHAPVAPRVSIVHGDYRTGNYLQAGGRISAVLDWELVHLGDPHDDLGWASLPMYQGGTRYVSRLIEPERFLDMYRERVDFPVSEAAVRYYRVLALAKLSATHMAGARCFEEGRFNDMRMPALGSQIVPTLRQMEKAIDAA